MIGCACFGGSTKVEEFARVVKELCNEFWQFIIDERPEFAIYRGVKHNRECLDSFSLDTYKKRKEFCKIFKERLLEVEKSFFKQENFEHVEHGGIDSEMSLAVGCKCQLSAIDVAVLKCYMETCLCGIDFGKHLIPYNYWEGVDIYFIKHTLERLPFITESDYHTYLTLLRAFPKQVAETIELLKEGLRVGIVAHKLSIVPSVLNRLQLAAECDPASSPFYEPFNNMPTSISEHTRSQLKESGLKVVQDCVQSPIKNLHQLIVRDYVPHLRTVESTDSMPHCCAVIDQSPNENCAVIGGEPQGAGSRRSLYETMLRYYTSLDNITPQQVHDLGIAELKAVYEKFDKVKEKLNFKGTTREFATYMQSLPERYFSSPEEILESIRHVVFDVIRPKLSKLFYDIPKDFELSIRPFPHDRDVAKAIYNGPTQDGSCPAILWVSISQPKRYARSELYTLMLHEAEPGHHLQSCVAMTSQDLPLFRKLKDDRRYFEIPGCFPSNEAYSEGWAMYCEYLGYELGFFDDPYAEYSHLCSDMVRSCRLIVDTGIHALGWSRDEAIKYMEENTFCTAAGIVNEVDRYITWPAQVCSYKVGQLKFLELRRKAEEALGERFDIKRFHKVCLDCGQVPLQILEEIVSRYISSEKQHCKSTT